MALHWSFSSDASAEDLAILADGVLAHGRLQARDGQALPVACLVRDDGRVVAGASGRTEYRRLFVSYLWVEAGRRRQGLGRRILLGLEAEAASRGCTDALIETLDEAVAGFYGRLGYRPLAVVPAYVGPFNRHILVKTLG